MDNEGLFRWFCSGAPGCSGDSGVLQHSRFYHAAQAERTKPAEERRILSNGAVILGDSAFAESEWMRTPIPKPICRAERFFNYKHSSQRFRVEHAYGRVKKKFPALAKGLYCHISNAPLLVNACVVLHNFIFALEGMSPRDQGKDNAPTKNGTGHNIVGTMRQFRAANYGRIAKRASAAAAPRAPGKGTRTVSGARHGEGGGAVNMQL